MAKKEKNLFGRLTKLFRSGPVVKRKIRALDTTTAKPDTSKSSGTLLFQKSLSPTYATITSNAYNLSERLMRYQDFCFGGDVIVYTLDGAMTFKELAERYPNGERFFVYSYDYELKQPVIGTAFYPRLAREGKKSSLLRVKFDDGGHIDVTPDHKMILRDGSTCEAKDLKVNDSLMPLYVSDINGQGYNWVYMLGRKTTVKSGWLQEHRLVAEQLLGTIADEHEVHHVDFNKKNNHPSNLKVMHHFEHRRYHARLNNVNKIGIPNESHSNWMKINAPTLRNDVTFNSIVDSCRVVGLRAKDVCESLNADINVVKLRLRERGFKNWVDFQSRFIDAQAIATHETIVNESRTPSIEEIISLKSECNSLDEMASRLRCSRNAINRRLMMNGHGGWTQFKTGAQYDGKKRGPSYTGPSYQAICSAFRQGMTMEELASACDSTKNKIGTCLKHNGFVSYTEWSKQQKNHKVASIDVLDDDFVYTVTVEKHHNLAVGSPALNNEKRPLSLVFATQSEMEYTPEIASALDIYADETVAQDDMGKVLHVYSENEKIKETLEELFYDTLNVEFNARSWVRNLVKYGDAFMYVDVDPKYGVVNAFPIPVNEIEREENFDREDPFAVRFRWVTMGNRTLENWEIAHFRLLGNDMFLPYGSSIIEPARRIWRQLILIEDAMLVYRVCRAPERRVFYIDVANVPPENVSMYVEEQKKTLRSSQVVDGSSGRVDLRYNPMPVHKDTPVPLLDGRTLTIEQLSREHEQGNDLWVYSVQDGTHQIVPGKVTWCGRNYTAYKIVKVTLDDGTYVKTAPEHPFILHDGTVKRADELLNGDSLLGRVQDGSFKTMSDFIASNSALVNRHVTNVETVNESVDVYCMTVTGANGEDDRHNFAVLGLSDQLSDKMSVSSGNYSLSGIFVKNSVEEDYFLPVRGADTGTRIDTLKGGENTAAVEDVAYIQKKLFAALKIPRAYLGYDDALSSKATLAQEDIRFSRTINVIQKTLIAELNKIAIIHLYAHGFDGEDLQNFTLRLSNPSSIAQQQKLELWRAKFEIGGSMPEGMGSATMVQREIWGLTPEKIMQLRQERLEEKLFDAKIEAAVTGAGGEGGDDLLGDLGSGGPPGGGGGGGPPAPKPEKPEAGGEKTPPPETAGEIPDEEQEPEVELLTSAEDPQDGEERSLSAGGKKPRNAPIKASDRIKHYKYNRSRIDHGSAGRTHMPDFAKMTGNNNDAMKDPYDSGWLKSITSNPFSESVDVGQTRTAISKQMISMLARMRGNERHVSADDSLLTEGIEVIDDLIETGTDAGIDDDDD